MNREKFLAQLKTIKTLSGLDDRELYSHDIGDLPPTLTKFMFKILPDMVVQPKNIQEVQRVIQLANEQGIPVVVRGAASWGLGGTIPVCGGIVIDLSPMRKIISMNSLNKTIKVEAGARWADVDIFARKEGLCLMAYPSSKFSTVGGWIATGGYGINSYKYGHISEQIVSMSVVTGNGDIRLLSPADDDFHCFVSTEGTFGVISEVTIRLRDIPGCSNPHLLYFPDDKSAFAFVQSFVTQNQVTHCSPDFIRFLDANHLSDINHILRVDIFENKPAVLFEFSCEAEEQHFLAWLTQQEGVEEAPVYVAAYLWNERVFGMKTKRLGPTILASEVLILIKSAPDFIRQAKKIGSYFGVVVCIDSFILDSHRALVMSTFLCDSRKLKYYINLPLVSMLTKTAVSFGAKPYGLGIWNSVFINKLYNKDGITELKTCKTRLDPAKVFNRGKPFAKKSGLLPSFFFHPLFFIPAISMLMFFAPVVGKLCTAVLGRERKLDGLDYELSIHACAKCGNCVTVCPAYLLTHDETLTAKGKIALAKKLIADDHGVTQAEAYGAFMCMHCRICEEVCETNLELMKLWDALETQLEQKFGRPNSQITEFINKIEDSREYWDMVELNGYSPSQDVL